MCPFCLATVAIVAGSASGTGGLTALLAGTILKRKREDKRPDQIRAKEFDDGCDDNRSDPKESGFA
jgi:hypothetical protein